MGTSNAAFLILLAVLAGMAVPIQAAVNARLADSLGHPIPAAAVALGLGCITLLVLMLAGGIPLTSFSAIRSAPPGHLVGGLFGALFVASMVYAVPRLGVALSVGLTVAGQMAVSLVIDHFGWMGVEQRGISVWRAAGVVLITLGVVMLKRF